MQNLAVLQESSRCFGSLANGWELSFLNCCWCCYTAKVILGNTCCRSVPSSYFTPLDIESIRANRITPYWIYNCWQPMTLHLIGYWTADTPALSQLIQVWMHNLDSQSYYNLLNAAAPPANLVTTYWSVNKESHIVSSWIGTRDNEWEPIMLRLIGCVGASGPGRGFTGQREPRCSGAASWNL